MLKTCFTSWKSITESQSEEKLIIIQSDQNSEYKDLKRKLEWQDIKIKFTAVYTSEQNDISEHLNHILVETTLRLLVDIKLSYIFWEEVISHANWLWNYLLLSDVSIIKSKILYKVWFNDQKLNLCHIKIFKSLILVYVSIKTDRAKLDKKVFNNIFIDYQSEMMNHWV